MRCIYCDKEIEKISFKSLLLKEDLLCLSCRKRLKPKREVISYENINVETFFDYDGLFKNVLIQYKECFDEALHPIFLYDLKEYIEYRYHDYYLCLIPSSKEKITQRGFNHLELICKDLRLKRINLEMKEDISQVNKGAKDRYLMKNNYLYAGNKVNKILVIDDVVTTGSSLIGAYNALKPYSNKISFLALSYKKIKALTQTL